MSIEQAQEQLQTALFTTFMANLYFLNEIDPFLYERVDRLSQMINKGEYKENYSLDFLEDVGEFDIYDHKNKRYMYNKRPKMINQQALDMVNFTSKSSISILDSSVFQGKIYKDATYETEYFCDFNIATQLIINDMTEYVKIFKNNISDYKTKEYNYFKKFIFIGTLLGRHIPLILEKIKADTFLVCEQNLEIFRLSLFVVDYSVLARDGKKVAFSIMDDETRLRNAIRALVWHKRFENYTIKYYSTNHNVKEYFTEIMTSIVGDKSTIFNYYMRLENIWRNTAKRINNYNFLQFKAIVEDKKIQNRPVLFLAAGPSLKEHIEWVKANQDRFIVVAIGATIQTLMKYDIKPDILTTLDPQYEHTKKVQLTDEAMEYLQDSIVLASANTDGRFVDGFNQNRLFLYEVLYPLHSNNLITGGYSVGEMTTAMVVLLGFNDIYFLGFDLAINQKTGATHTEGYEGSEIDYKEDFRDKVQKDDFTSFSMKGELIELKGNMLEKVLTNRVFAMSIDAFNYNMLLLKKDEQNIYNLSENGAYLDKTEPLSIEDLKLPKKIDKDKLQKELISFLEKSSKDRLSDKDSQKLKKELKYLGAIRWLLGSLKDEPSKNFEEFDFRVQRILKLFSNEKIGFGKNIFDNYFELSLQYIYYCLNDKNLKQERKKIEESESLLILQIGKLLNRYEEYLKYAIND